MRSRLGFSWPAIFILFVLSTGFGSASAFVPNAAWVVTGDTLLVEGREIRLAGIVAPDLSDVCRIGGKREPCGQTAARMLDARIGGRAVGCEASNALPSDPDRALCRFAGQDLGLWMIREGWAWTTPEAPRSYHRALAGARERKVGLWRTGLVLERAGEPAAAPPEEPSGRYSFPSTLYHLRLSIFSLWSPLLVLTAAGIGFYFTRQQIRISRQQQTASILLDLDRRWESAELAKSRREIATFDREVAAKAGVGGSLLADPEFSRQAALLLAAMPETDPKRYASIMKICSFFETAGYVAGRNYLSYDDVIGIFGGAIVLADNNLREHIRTLQKEDARLYSNFISLADHLRANYL